MHSPAKAQLSPRAYASSGGGDTTKNANLNVIVLPYSATTIHRDNSSETANHRGELEDTVVAVRTPGTRYRIFIAFIETTGCLPVVGL
jgi:hypothetical protein